MNFKEKVQELLKNGLEQYPDLFLIDLSISSDYKINITIDGDKGVSLQDCIDISRSVEHHLDREEQDFSIEVASAGATSPLKLPRQYKKNIGRKIEVTTENSTIEAQLVEADEEKITVEWKAREPKKIGKGKETIEKKAIIPYTEIKKAVIVISF